MKTKRKKVFYLTIIILLFFVFLFLKESNEENYIPLNPDFVFEPAKLQKSDYDNVAEILLSNRSYLFKDFENHSYSNNSPWGELTNTYNLYLNCLYDPYYLIILYRETNDVKYLEKSKDLINLWFQYEKSEKAQNDKYVWNDHSVPKRTLTFIHFSLEKNEENKALFNKELTDKINHFLILQGEWLYDEDNYSIGNHGLMMDRALLVLGIYLKNDSYVEKSIKRINDRIETDFTDAGIHTENSTSYHIMVVQYFKEIFEFLEYHNMITLLQEDSIERINKATDYLIYITMPNGFLARIGDSRTSSFSQSYDNDNLRYVASKGEEGIKPTKNFKYYKDAGIAVFREAWEKESFSDSLWWTIKSGSKNPVHKQDDDLSFKIFNLGNEIFSDSGNYNYERENIFAKYANSPQGHNSISVKNESYFARENLKRIKLLKLEEERKDYIWLSGENHAYEKTIIRRDFFFLKPNTFLLFDQIFSEEEKKYTQHFLLGPNMKINHISKNLLFAESKDKKANAELKQHLEIDNFFQYKGDEETGKGYIFEKFEGKTPVSYIEFETKGISTQYATTIQLNNNDYQNNINFVKMDSDILYISINEKLFSFDIKILK